MAILCKALRAGEKASLLILAALVLGGCAGSGEVVGEGPELRPRRPSAEISASHLILVGFDGWGAYSLARADMPAVKGMMARGASTMKAQSVLPTNSWPNWSALFFGSSPDVHGYAEPETAPAGREFFPLNIFSLLKQQRPESVTALFYEWEKIGWLCPPGAADRAEHVPNLSARPEEVEKIAGYLKEEKPNLAVIIFDEPDSTGHNKGYGSRAYYQKLTEMDALFARLEAAVQEGGYYNDTVFILTADHGGILWGHGFNTPRQRNIPLIISGKNIRENFAIPGKINIYDIAPSMVAVLGLEIPPAPAAAWTGRVLEEIFIP